VRMGRGILAAESPSFNLELHVRRLDTSRSIDTVSTAVRVRDGEVLGS
jgi:hypothetical protein